MLAGVAVVAVLALALDVLLYVALRSNLYGRLDDELDLAARVVASEAERPAAASLADRLDERGVRATVKTADGRILDVAGSPVAPGEAVVRRTVEHPSRTTTIELVVSRESADRTLRTLLAMEAGVTPLVVALAFVLLRLISEYALEPLERITAAARRTAGGTRGERLRPEPADTRLGQMAAAYDSMLDALEKAVDDAEAAKAESDRLLERNRRILATAREAFVAVDDDDRIVDWNDQAQRLFGWRRADVLDRTFAGTVTPSGPDAEAMPLAAFAGDGDGDGDSAGRVTSLVALHRDGHRFPVRMIAWTTRHRATSTTSAFLWDATAEASAQEATARLAALVESADEAMLSTTLDGTILTWNSGAESMYGYTADEAVGRHVDLIVPTELRPAVRESLDAVLRGEPVQRGMTTRRCRNGELIEVAVTISPVRDPDGSVAAVSSIDRDVTEERWIARQLDDTLVALEHAAREAQASEAATRRFLDDAAHQLRAPITNIQASAEVLARSGDMLAAADREAMLGAVVRETARAGRLVAGLLRIARLDQGSPLAKAPCDPVALCETLADNLRNRAPALTVTVAADGGAAAPLPLLDADAVSEIVSNLVDNARRHAVTAVDVQVRRRDGAVEIEVADDGPGVRPDQVGTVFERFVSLDGKGGSGLGLSIARELARAHGGDLTYERNAFVVRLPTLDEGTGDPGDLQRTFRSG